MHAPSRARPRPGTPRLTALLLAVAMTATGCADVVFLDEPPPSMRLEPSPTVTIVPTHVTIMNGAGEVLVDQGLSAPYRVEANPPLDKLDGKLKVETRWDNGTVSIRELTHTPGARVSLVQDGQGYKVVERTPTAERGGGD